MVTIRTLLVVALLVVPSMPASAGLADADAGWGDAGFVEVGFYAVGFSPEPDGTKGCTVESFCPDEPVTRAQMASFLVRAGLTD